MGTSSFKCFDDNKKNKNKESAANGEIKSSNGGNLIKDVQNREGYKNNINSVQENEFKVKVVEKKNNSKKFKKSKTLKSEPTENKKDFVIKKKGTNRIDKNLHKYNKNEKEKDNGEEKIKKNNDKKEEKIEPNEIKENKEVKKEDRKEKIKRLKASNLMTSYLPPIKVENNYYIVCPTCKILFPTIKKFEYDKKAKDFEVSYCCNCNSSKKLRKSYFLNFINGNRPPELNKNFNEKKMPRKLLKAANENEDFPGKELSSIALEKSININGAAPPASVNKSIKDSTKIKEEFPHFKASRLHPIKEEDENNNKNREVIFSNVFDEDEKNMAEEEGEEENNSDYIEYVCDKTFNKNARIASLI